MAKNIQPTSIPINAKLSLAEVDDIVHNMETPAFADKNSITFQGLIRNAHINEADGYLTTHGRHLKKEQLLDVNGNKIGTKLIDDLGKVYEVKHNWLLKDSFQLKNFSGGNIISATIYEDKIYELYNDQDTFIILVIDKKQNEVVGLKQLDCISATIGSRFNTSNPPTLWLLKSHEKTEGGFKNIIESIELVENFTINTFEQILPERLGHDLTATDIGTQKIVGFEDIDQERRYFFRWKKEAPTTLEATKYFGTIAPNGMITGEPIPYIEKSDGSAAVFEKGTDLKRMANGVLAWNVKNVWQKSGNSCKLGMQVGYLPNGKAVTTKLFNGDANTTYKYWIAANISINDTAPGTYPGDDPRAKPKEWFISNYADSKDIYYAWGQGWARCYYRTCLYASPKVVDLGIFTAGAAPGYSNEPTDKPYQRHECLMAKGKVKEWDYTNKHLNERVYTLGGNNKDENNLLGAVPFTVDLFYQGTDDEADKNNIDVFRAQVFATVETSYSFLQTLLTTPSEINNESPINLVWNQGQNLTIFANGEIYEVIKSSDSKDFWLDKVADYAFRLNVMDGKNALKEDRDGNLSLVRAFIPYNMEAIIKIDHLKLTPPKSDNAKGNPDEDGKLMDKDSNDAWYEGIGKNVNLFVNDISMSFLFPKIRLGMWIKNEEKDELEQEAIERRNSILQPALRGCFLEGESVDTYYTLQSVTQDCLYKTTQLILNGEEAEKPENQWNKFGKSTYEILRRGFSWWMDNAGTIIFPIGIGSIISGINFITPSAQLPQGYSSRLFTKDNQLFLGFNYTSQIWHGATIFTIYGQNYYYDQQGIYFLGADQDFSNNNFVTYALGMKYLANSGSEAYFYSDFEKRLYVFTGSNTLQPADLLSNINGTIKDAAFSSKEQTLYMLTSEGRIIVRTMSDLCQLPGMDPDGHLEGTTEGCAIVGKRVNEEGEYVPTYKVFSPYKGEKVLPFALRTEHFGSPDIISKLAYIDVILYKTDDSPTITFTCQTLNGIEKNSETVTIKIKKDDWKGSQYRFRFTPKLNTGNAFDIGIYSKDEIGVQNICFYTTPLWTGQGDAWQHNVVNETMIPDLSGTSLNRAPSISIGK